MDRVYYSFYSSLKYLDFEKFIKLNKSYDIEFNEKLFLKSNQKAFEIVTYFLFKQLKGDEWIRQFRGCFPCLDKKHESDFRKVVMLHFKKLETDKNFNCKFLPGILHNPGGDSFITLYLSFVNYILKKKLNLTDHNNLTLNELAEICMNDCIDIENKIKCLQETMKKNENTSLLFYNKLDDLEKKKKNLLEQNVRLDQLLKQKYGTNNVELLVEKLEINFKKIQSHPLTKLREKYNDLLDIDSFNFEENVFNMAELTKDELSLDLKIIGKKLNEKIEKNKIIFQKDLTNLSGNVTKLQQKNLLYVNTKDLLSTLMQDLFFKINLMKQNLENKKKKFLNQDHIQKLLKLCNLNLNINPIELKFEFKKSDFPMKRIFLSPNRNNKEIKHNHTPQGNSSSELNMSFSFAEISTYNFIPPEDENYI